MAASERGTTTFWHRPVIRFTLIVVCPLLALLAIPLIMFGCSLLSFLFADYPPEVHPAATAITSQNDETTHCNITTYKVNARYTDVVDYYLTVLTPEPHVYVHETTDQTLIEVTECFDCFGTFIKNTYLIRPIDSTTSSLETRTCE